MLRKNNSLYVGFFLAVREIKRSSPWTTGLIILVICLTFFNMLFLGGILLGFAGAALGTYHTYYSGDIFIVPATNKRTIEQTDTVLTVISSLPTIQAYSKREGRSGILEYNYQNKIKMTDLAESASGEIMGIDPVRENKFNNLSGTIVAGSYLLPTDSDQILVGSNLMKKYATVRGAILSVGSKVLQNADIGSRVRLTINGTQKEVTIKGVFTTNSVSVDSRVYMVDSTFREMTGSTSLNASEIAIKLQPGASDIAAKNYIIKNLKDNKDVIVETSNEAIPGSIFTIFEALRGLSRLVGGIALLVSAFTIFIVIYVNAITRRKFIGILKGIGISSHAIQISYIFQALFYAICGITIASIFILGLLKPYIDLHPLNFANISASLAIGLPEVIPNAIALLITAFISGFIPAWIVTRQNTLDAILGR
jgi:putative ABC transport system permease protein